MIETRWSSFADAPALARIHEDAWRFAYALNTSTVYESPPGKFGTTPCAAN